MTETEDGEEYMKIQQIFSVRLKALGAQKKREGSVAKPTIPVPKSTSTPNNPPTCGETLFDTGVETETTAGRGTVSKPLATASLERKMDAGENIVSTPVIPKGARPKVIVTKNVANISDEPADEDWVCRGYDEQ